MVRFGATLKLQTNKPTINMEPHSSEVTAAAPCRQHRSQHLLSVWGLHPGSSSLQIQIQIYPESDLQVDRSAPLWIIVVSVLAGVLLLALICLLLWKVN